MDLWAVILLVLVIGFAVYLQRAHRGPRSERSAPANGRPAPEEALAEDERCERCGYDLRATPDRCPECGKPTKAVHRRWLKELAGKVPADWITERRVGANETPVTLLQTTDGLLARALAEHLMARGITCRLERPMVPKPELAAYFGGPAMVEGDLRLVAWSGDAQLARELIERLLADEPRDMTENEAET